MSRRDPRKALTLRLTEPLRRALVRTSTAHLPLPYLVRQTLRRALAEDAPLTQQMAPGPLRPILLQLTADERSRIETLAKACGLSEEETVLSLLASRLLDGSQSD